METELIESLCRSPGKSQGGTLKFHNLAVYKDKDAAYSGAIEIAQALPRRTNFLSLTEMTPIVRRFDLSEVTLQCAIVVSDYGQGNKIIEIN